jgi:hydrogenase nickel incorporation protein HypA/HybF
MHEIQIARALSAIVLEVSEKEKLSVVTGVDISFGRMIQVVPEIFEFAFRECVRGSIAGDAKLNIEILPVRIRCRRCNEEMELGDLWFICNKCGSADLDIIHGKEMFVKSIEGE